MFFKKAKCFTILFKTLHVTPRRSTSNFFKLPQLPRFAITSRTLVKDITNSSERYN